MKYYIKTFGCQQNFADSERIAAAYQSRGFKSAKDIADTNHVVINTCMIRESAENRVYGLIEKLAKIKEQKLAGGNIYKIILTGCIVGLAYRDTSGKFLQRLKKIMPEVDEFMPIEEVGFDHPPLRRDKNHAWVTISNGCNNFCTFCVVPFTRGREISRPFSDIIAECQELKAQNYRSITLLGQNVNSYGADLLIGTKNIQVMRDLDKKYFTTLSHPKQEKIILLTGQKINPVYVKHLGRYRIPTLFPYLLEKVAQLGFETVNFISANPWDFSQTLIDVIAKYKNISRTIHLPVQSGDDNVLRRMNRWYTAKEYLDLVAMIRKKIPEVRFTTDIIVGFCGETEKEFANTVSLARQIGFQTAYIAIYSPRPQTAATKIFADDVPYPIKKKRWQILENLINKPHLSKNIKSKFSPFPLSPGNNRHGNGSLHLAQNNWPK